MSLSMQGNSEKLILYFLKFLFFYIKLLFRVKNIQKTFKIKMRNKIVANINAGIIINELITLLNVCAIGDAILLTTASANQIISSTVTANPLVTTFDALSIAMKVAPTNGLVKLVIVFGCISSANLRESVR